MEKIKVLVVDDHSILRAGICSLLSNNNDDIEVVGEASDGLEAIDKVLQLLPDIVLMDIAMPSMDGLEATRHIHNQRPETKVIILTRLDDPEYVLAGIDAGAAGCITKAALPSELVSAIHAIYKGNSFLCPSAAKVLIKSRLQEERHDEYESLTRREKEVLRLIAEGLSNREIAERLVISVKTVLGHRTSIMGKLDIHNRTDLIKYAIRKKLIVLET